MGFVNFNAFVLGVLFFGTLYLVTLVRGLVCHYYEIRITEFSVFYKPGLTLHSGNVGGTKFSLGWVPLSVAIGMLGWGADAADREEMDPDDVPFAIFSKPKMAQYLIPLSSLFVSLLFLSVSILLLAHPGGFLQGINTVWVYFSDALHALFGNEEQRKQFGIVTRHLAGAHHVLPFAFAVLCLFMLIANILQHFLDWLMKGSDEGVTIMKILYIVYLIVLCWLYFWKLPKFLFSYFSLTAGLSYIAGYLAGVFVAGIVLYFATFIFARAFAQKSSREEVLN